MVRTIVIGSIATSIWELLTQLPSNELFVIVISIFASVMVVLFYEPACSRLIRIIKAFTEVQRTKER